MVHMNFLGMRRELDCECISYGIEGIGTDSLQICLTQSYGPKTFLRKNNPMNWNPQNFLWNSFNSKSPWSPLPMRKAVCCRQFSNISCWEFMLDLSTPTHNQCLLKWASKSRHVSRLFKNRSHVDMFTKKISCIEYIVCAAFGFALYYISVAPRSDVLPWVHVMFCPNYILCVVLDGLPSILCWVHVLSCLLIHCI